MYAGDTYASAPVRVSFGQPVAIAEREPPKRVAVGISERLAVRVPSAVCERVAVVIAEHVAKRESSPSTSPSSSMRPPRNRAALRLASVTFDGDTDGLAPVDCDGDALGLGLGAIVHSVWPTPLFHPE